ncbi:LLM class flavin-dependent oxidoreductase [Rhizobium puerariae]|uniref:LLM class flavin-dependent oxidoreductase n=1 Tax=Rhizobium puerariae TaxID=1585791 RepID=A0ABV6AF15_9HYPH
MATGKRQMKLGASIRGLGYNASAWRHPDVDPGASESFAHFAECARIAEAAKFDTVFFADGLAIRAADEPKGSLCRSHENVELEPVTLLSALSVVTKNIGLVATASTSYNEPYHVARKYASLDHLSGGRAGWNAVTSWSEQEAWNFNRDEHYGKDERYDRANEFIEVVLGLWDSWDADAFIHDVEGGRFYDPEKMHVLDFKGRYFKVRGPLTSSRTPQGRPVIFQAGASDKGLDLAGRFADAVYMAPHTLDAAIKGRSVIRERAAAFGRSMDDVKILPGAQLVGGRTRGQAEDKLEYLKSLIDPLSAMARIAAQFGDLSVYDLDSPLPDDLGDSGKITVSSNMIRKALENRWTLRKLCQEVGMGQQLVILGSYDEIADTMQEWFDKGGADGFNVMPSYLPGGLADVAEHIVPRLQDRGVFRKEYEGSTLRENLGLARPASRYA